MQLLKSLFSCSKKKFVSANHMIRCTFNVLETIKKSSVVEVALTCAHRLSVSFDSRIFASQVQSHQRRKMASNTQGIQQLLAAEKKAAEKVGEARKRECFAAIFIFQFERQRSCERYTVWCKRVTWPVSMIFAGLKNWFSDDFADPVPDNSPKWTPLQLFHNEFILWKLFRRQSPSSQAGQRWSHRGDRKIPPGAREAVQGVRVQSE